MRTSSLLCVTFAMAIGAVEAFATWETRDDLGTVPAVPCIDMAINPATGFPAVVYFTQGVAVNGQYPTYIYFSQYSFDEMTRLGQWTPQLVTTRWTSGSADVYDVSLAFDSTGASGIGFIVSYYSDPVWESRVYFVEQATQGGAWSISYQWAYSDSSLDAHGYVDDTSIAYDVNDRACFGFSIWTYVRTYEHPYQQDEYDETYDVFLIPEQGNSFNWHQEASCWGHCLTYTGGVDIVGGDTFHVVHGTGNYQTLHYRSYNQSTQVFDSTPVQFQGGYNGAITLNPQTGEPAILHSSYPGSYQCYYCTCANGQWSSQAVGIWDDVYDFWVGPYGLIVLSRDYYANTLSVEYPMANESSTVFDGTSLGASMVLDPHGGMPYVAYGAFSEDKLYVAQQPRVQVTVRDDDTGSILTNAWANVVRSSTGDYWLHNESFLPLPSSPRQIPLVPPCPTEKYWIMAGASGYEGKSVQLTEFTGLFNMHSVTIDLVEENCGTPASAGGYGANPLEGAVPAGLAVAAGLLWLVWRRFSRSSVA